MSLAEVVCWMLYRAAVIANEENNPVTVGGLSAWCDLVFDIRRFKHQASRHFSWFD